MKDQRQASSPPLSYPIASKSFFGSLKNFLVWLVTPTKDLARADLRHQSRLLAEMLIGLTPLGLLVEALSVGYARRLGVGNYGLTAVFILGLVVAFFLNRNGHLVAAARTTVAVLSAGVFVLTFSTNESPLPLEYLGYLFLPLLFSSVFLSEKTIVVLTGLYFGAFLVIYFVPGIDRARLILGPGSFILIAAGMIYLIFHYRNLLEADRQRELTEKEERYRTLLESSYEGICILIGDTVVDANPNFARLFGFSPEEVLGKPVDQLGRPGTLNHLIPSMHSQKEHPSRMPVHRADGSLFYIEAVSKLQTYRGQPAQVIGIRDITERVQAEEALDQNERLYRTLFEGANDAIFLLNLEDRYVAANQKGAAMLGYSVNELLGRPMSDIVVRHEYPNSMKVKSALLSGETVPIYERIFRTKNGTEFTAEINATLVHDRDGKPAFIQSIVRDVTERKLTDERVQRQLEHLKALRNIDRMISASLDLKMTLDVLLGQVVSQLGVDATDILLFAPNQYHLEVFARRGFQADEVQHGSVSLDDGLAGRAAVEDRPYQVLDLKPGNGGERLERLARQGFACGYAVPLTAKGMVKGVLEVFQRKPFEPAPEWIDFLETLGGQAAIALDSAELFRNLQRTNLDLMRAYDATLEGWARALELRDEGTEGHSQRVTEMTLTLGRALGIQGDELVHLRRGALLHDIGKMGIPDSILLKRDTLTAEEWVIMKKHPIYAHEMLASIPFLRLAMDIPYYHHEKWDGTGYPTGLKGQDIPLAARIFAVVDVWDALCSVRPYRPAWPEDKTRDYIRSQSGIHFDPEVVAAFMKIIDRDVARRREEEQDWGM